MGFVFWGSDLAKRKKNPSKKDAYKETFKKP